MPLESGGRIQQNCQTGIVVGPRHQVLAREVARGLRRGGRRERDERARARRRCRAACGARSWPRGVPGANRRTRPLLDEIDDHLADRARAVRTTAGRPGGTGFPGRRAGAPASSSRKPPSKTTRKRLKILRELGVPAHDVERLLDLLGRRRRMAGAERHASRRDPFERVGVLVCRSRARSRTRPRRAAASRRRSRP